MKTFKLSSDKNELFTIRVTDKSTFLNPSKVLTASVGDLDKLAPATLQAIFAKVTKVEIVKSVEADSVDLDDL